MIRRCIKNDDCKQLLPVFTISAKKLFLHFNLQGGGRSSTYFCNLIILKFLANATFLYLFKTTEKTFFSKSTLRLSWGYATFVRLRSSTSKAEILMPIWCFWRGDRIQNGDANFIKHVWARCTKRGVREKTYERIQQITSHRLIYLPSPVPIFEPP